MDEKRKQKSESFVDHGCFVRDGKVCIFDQNARHLLANKSFKIFPVCFSFNTKLFEAEVLGNAEDGIASRLLMSYFLEPSAQLRSKTVEKKLKEFFPAEEDILLFAVDYIINDLTNEYNVENPKLFIGCDEVMRCKMSVRGGMVPALTSLLESKDNVCLLCTGLDFDPFNDESKSGRLIVNILIPLLSVKSLVSFLKTFDSDEDIAKRLAFLSGGHPRSIQIM